ncbi:ParA family protein [Rhodococcus sp. BP-252]|uniref:MinD/ParA family ATP-binding protein n=1 Tax=unclassified Rhodococcus (in: high G+C Gram-positive bacteria) TaxID=192944 RepID=UPI001C9B8414|nr:MULTISPECIES: ParA family protein [unclassified Rhodococcus (in: high G+C Gram-positive bacteria)]MBY6412866.1 ParA family protein [Rhodococcus sp. BP-320]MBY6417597.1 ParA family protein [Rhodococcus sp. BP-321]MBY6423031.1 ParA family protein [Rhodococcus sp. BP-324]MBY6427621.1 ParA family protein [Rhodococcus sp. BP-323]MBY6432785.1 ParA family protein [Rhodococcus sp. BP-322]
MSTHDPARSADDHEVNPVADYQAESAVNLRSQRLRRPDPQPDETDTASADSDLAPDPYGVGQDALAAIDAPEVDPDALYRARMFDRVEEDLTAEPATWGLRGRVNAAFGAHMRPKPNTPEVRFRQSVHTVQQPLPGCSVVSVMNPKGGAGKTPTALMLGATFGTHRGQGVAVWDASESTGSLGDRAARTTDPELTVWDLLEHAGELASTSAVSGSLNAFLRRQPTMDDILAADNSTTQSRSIGWDECAAVMAVLRRHRDLIVVDTGNNPLADNWQWAVQHSDVLVVPLPLRMDIAKQVYLMLDGIAARGYGHLLASTVVVTCMTPDSSPELSQVIFDDLSDLGIAPGNFVEAPYEPALARGGRIVYKDLPAATIEGYTNVTALVADALGDARRAAAFEYTDPHSPESLHRHPPERSLPQLSHFDRRRSRRGA